MLTCKDALTGYGGADQHNLQTFISSSKSGFLLQETEKLCHISDKAGAL